MKRIKYLPEFLFVFALIFLSSFQTTKAQFSIVIEQITDRTNIDPSNYPYHTFKIKGYVGSTEVMLNKNDVYVLEENKASTLVSLSDKVDGWQTAVWQSRAKNMDTMVYVQILAVYNGMMSGFPGAYRRPNYSQVWIASYQQEQIDNMKFGIVTPGSTDLIQIYVIPAIGKLNDEGFETSIMIDSITFTTPYFTYNWQGHPINRTPPPVKVPAGFQFLVDIKFTPPDNKYVRDIMTVYFDGGVKKQLFISGNHFDIENKTSLKLLQPNGGNLFAPCEDYVIKWKGHNPILPVSLEFSPDSGATWRPVVSYQTDSTYHWKIPDIPTENGLIRVKQDFNKTQEVQLLNHASAVMGITYNAAGTNILTVERRGRINLYDLMSGSRNAYKSFYLDMEDYPNLDYYIYGIDYLVDNRKFAVAYYDYLETRTNKLAYFNYDSEKPESVVDLPADFPISKMFIDPRKRFIALMPSAGTSILLLNPDDGSVIGSHQFGSPVMSFTFDEANDRAAVSLLNGTVRIISLAGFPNITDLTDIDLSYLPIIIQTGLSPDGKLLSVGCRAFGSGWYTDIHVIDIATKQIVRSPIFTHSDPIGVEFNPASTNLVSGSAFQPQIQFWNLPLDEAAISMSGHSGAMTTFKISPDGHTIATGGSSSDNLFYRSFTYPEFDVSDTTFRIVRPIIETKKADIAEAFIDTENLHVFTTHFCNTGETPIVLLNTRFRNGIHFRLAVPLTPDTLFPGECLTIPIVFNPIDTGKITDSLIFSHCTGEIFFDIESKGLKRNLTFFQDLIDFGEVCIDETGVREFNLFRNDDPVDVRINGILIEGGINSPYKIVNPPGDTILPPGGIMKIQVRFIPKALGVLPDKVLVYHSKQVKMIPFMSVSGKGIGTFIDFKPNPMPFIPEIKKRFLVMSNTGETELFINSVSLAPDNIFRINTQLPMRIPPKGTDSLEVEWFGPADGVSTVYLNLEAVPCLVQKSILLMFFDGSSKLSIPVIEADPRGETVIPINFKNSSNTLYQGERFFETEISINPRMFLPVEVKSDYGNAELTRNDIVAGRRIIGLRVEGNFPEEGVAANIRGIVGLAETDTSYIDFVNGAANWGDFVETSVASGQLKLIGLCEDRRILQNTNTVQILSITPNPAQDNITVLFESNSEGMCSVEIFDFLGNKTFATNPFSASQGTNSLKLALSALPAGNYRFVIRTMDSFTSTSLVIIR